MTEKRDTGDLGSAEVLVSVVWSVLHHGCAGYTLLHGGICILVK